MNLETRNAIHVTESTLLGYGPRTEPGEGGNCFSVAFEGGGGARILNFKFENLEALLKHHGLTWPIKVGLIEFEGKTYGVIQDERIHDRWYSLQFCSCCCPEGLLTLPQRLAHDRARARGQRVDHPDGVSMYDFSKGATIGAPPPNTQELAGFLICEERRGMSIGHTDAITKVDFQ